MLSIRPNTFHLWRMLESAALGSKLEECLTGMNPALVAAVKSKRSCGRSFIRTLALVGFACGRLRRPPTTKMIYTELFTCFYLPGYASDSTSIH